MGRKRGSLGAGIVNRRFRVADEERGTDSPPSQGAPSAISACASLWAGPVSEGKPWFENESF